MQFRNSILKRAERLLVWLDLKIKNSKDYSRNDPEFIEFSNKVILLKRKIKSMLKH